MAKQQITDEEDRLKRQARRRLIGAVALTTAVVVILPLVLDREPRPVGQNIELKIPDQDKAGAFAPRVDLPPASAVAAAVPVSAPVPASVPAPASAVPPLVAPAPASAVTPPVAVPAIAKPVAVAPEPKPAAPVLKTAPAPAKPAAVPEAKTDKAKPGTKAEPAKPDARKEPAKKDKSGAKTEKGQAAHNPGLILQIGAFNNADTAHSWQKNLKSQGFNAYTEKIGSKTRVRIGPYPTREAANAARKKLEKTQGLHANIVE